MRRTLLPRNRVASALLLLPLVFALAACEASGGRGLGDDCEDDGDCESGLCVQSLCIDGFADDDGDGLTNQVEARLQTDPNNADSDGDGLDDLREVRNTRQPVDSDGDGIIDARESATSDGDDDCIVDQIDAENDVQSAGARAYLDKQCLVGVCGQEALAELIAVGCEGGRLVCKRQALPEPYLEDEIDEAGCFDQLDNDCDGQTDEGSPDTDGDETPDCADDDDDDDGVPDEDDCLPLADRCASDCTDGDDDGQPDCLETCPGEPSVHCDDEIECTVDTCDEESGCVHTPDHVSCDDGEACTDDRCDAELGCVNEPNTEPCDADGDPCTVDDACFEGVCTPGGDVCGCRVDGDCASLEDGDLCNGTLRCDTAEVPYSCEIIPESVVECDDADDTTCVHSVCQPGSGQCAMVARNEDQACDDNNVCSSASTCQDGQCIGEGDLCDCGSDADCASFDDGDRCNGWYICDRSNPPFKCVFSAQTIPPPCNASGDGECMANQCVPATGACEMLPHNEGGACDDSIDCTGDGVCEEGTCQPGDVLLCDDGVACTADSCEEGTGCVHTPDDSVCDDTNPCTTNVCDVDDGCTFPADDEATCTDGDDCTAEDHCDGGSCVGTASCECQGDADCASHEDGNVCNGTLFCDTSTFPYLCVVNPATVVTCDDAQDAECRQNVCNPATGICAMGNVNEDGACDDEDPCTTSSFCTAGECRPGTDVCDCRVDADCTFQEDGNRCNGTLRCDTAVVPYDCVLDPDTVVTCDATADTECLHAVCQPLTGDCTPEAFNEGGDCSDGDACTTGDACEGGTCVAAGATDCDDGNDCSLDTCDAALGCQYADAEDGASCEDGEPCTSDDTCVQGSCSAGGATVCDDSDSCTADVCTTGVGCEFTTLDDDSPCEDGDLCTDGDVCLSGVCTTGPDETDCDDRRACTLDTCSPESGCAHEERDSECNDTVDCTIDTCDAQSGCVFTPDPTFCDDGVDCTVEACDRIEGCSSTPDNVRCDDQVECTVDACDAVDGCSNTPDPAACDDGVACTSDQCNIDTGCDNRPVDEACPADPSPCKDATCDQVLGCQVADNLLCLCQSLAFAGASDERVRVADSPGLSGGPDKSLTIEAWVRPGTTGPDLVQQIVSKLTSSTGGEWALLQMDTDFVFQFYPQGASVPVEVTASGAFTQDTWTHVAAVFDRSFNSVKLYVDGTLVTPAGNILDIEDTAADVYVGPNPDAGIPAFTGSIDEVRVWSTALTGLFLSVNMSRPVAPDTDGLVARWSFDDVGTATVSGAADFSGNGHDLLFLVPPTAAEGAPVSPCN